MRSISALGIAAALALVVPAANAAVTTVTQTVSKTNINDSLDVTLQCPSGYSPISGGWRLGDPNSSVFTITNPFNTAGYTSRFQVVGSHPNGQGWRIYGYTNNVVTVQLYAVCGT